MSYGESETIFAISTKNRVGQYLQKNFRRSRTKIDFFRDSAKIGRGSGVRYAGARRPPQVTNLTRPMPWLIGQGKPRGYFGKFWVFPNYFGNCFSTYSPSYLSHSFYYS